MHLAQEFLFWWASISALCLASRRLLCTTGGTVFSSGVVMSGAGIVAYWAIHYTQQPIIGLAAFITAAALLGVSHAPLALLLGGEATLLISVVFHMMWIEGWLAAPKFTGGSGGFFWPHSTSTTAIATLIGTLLISGTIEILGTSSAARYRAAVLIGTGRRSAVFGINRNQSIIVAYLAFGVVMGGIGYSIVNWIGYLSLESGSTSFATAILLMALGTRRLPVIELVVICGCQAGLRTILRSAFAVSPLTGHCLDLLLPLFLLFLIRESKTTH